MYYYDTPGFYESLSYLPKLSLIFLTTGSIIWLVWRFQLILQALITKNKGELTKMTTTPQDLKQIEKVHRLMGDEEKEETETKARPIGRLAGAMLFVVFTMLGMVLIVVINEAFVELKDIHIFAIITVSFLMIICAIAVFFIIYLENEEQSNTDYRNDLRHIFERENDSRLAELFKETRSMNQTIEKIERFLIAQYGQHYDESKP